VGSRSTRSVMRTLSLCDVRGHGRSDDQFATLVAKMPEDKVSTSEISASRKKNSGYYARVASGRNAL